MPGFPLVLKFVFLAAVAEVLFAIWARIFSKALADRRAAGTEEEAAIALRPVRWMSLGATLLRYGFFIALNVAGLARGASLIVPSFILFVALSVIHGQVRFALEREVRKIEATQFDAFRLASRMLLITLGIYVVYYAVYIGVLWAAAQIPGAQEGWAGWAAIPVGLFVALFVVYLASPLIVRMMFPNKRITDPAVLERLSRCFAKAGLPVPSFWILDLDRHKSHNAMVAGFKGGKGVFKPALFISNSLIEDMTPEELEAVILHEVSHVSLHHMRGRMIAGFLSVGLSLLPLVALATLGPYLLQPQQYALVLVACYVLAVFVQYSAMRWTVRLQELEADANALIRLGADPDAFARALTKLMRMNDQLDHAKDPSSYLSASAAHPTALQRVEAVHKRMHRKQMGDDPFPKGEWFNRVMEDWGSPLGSVTAVLLAATFYWYVSDGRPRMELRRAAEAGDIVAMETALERGASVDSMDIFDGGTTPLIAAVRSNQGEAVRFLLKNGADPNFMTPSRQTALNVADTSVEMRATLLASGAKEPSGAGRTLASQPVRDK